MSETSIVSGLMKFVNEEGIDAIEDVSNKKEQSKSNSSSLEIVSEGSKGVVNLIAKVSGDVSLSENEILEGVIHIDMTYELNEELDSNPPLSKEVICSAEFYTGNVTSQDYESVGLSRVVTEVPGYTVYDLGSRKLIANNNRCQVAEVNKVIEEISEDVIAGKLVKIPVSTIDTLCGIDNARFLYSQGDIEYILWYFKNYFTVLRKLQLKGENVSYEIVIGA